VRIVSVHAYAVKAANPGPTYWGSATWGKAGANVGAAAPAGRPGLWDRFPAPGRMQPVYSPTIDTTLVKLVTDTGLVGWGEAKAPVAPEVAQRIIEGLLADLVVGADPFDVEVLWERMYASMRLRGHSSGFLLEAISGVDIALWDLIGKATGQPIHKLLGGAYRERIKVYASGVPATRHGPGTPQWEHMLATARGLVERGFLGLKMGIGMGVETDVRCVEAVREAVGPDVAIFTDAAGNYDVSQSILLGRELERLGVGFLEAPLPHEFFDGYAAVAQALAIPVANDVLANRFQLLEYLKRGGLDVAQPDVCRAGGITELKRMVVLTDAFGVACTPHVSIGSAVHFAASLHVAAATPNLVPMEYWVGQNPLGDAILKRPVLQVVDGHVAVPAGPGLGIDIDEEKLARYIV